MRVSNDVICLCFKNIHTKKKGSEWLRKETSVNMSRSQLETMLQTYMMDFTSGNKNDAFWSNRQMSLDWTLC